MLNLSALQSLIINDAVGTEYCLTIRQVRRNPTEYSTNKAFRSTLSKKMEEKFINEIPKNSKNMFTPRIALCLSGRICKVNGTNSAENQSSKSTDFRHD